MHRERDGDVGARSGRDVEIGLTRERRRTRIDDDEPGALLLRLPDVRHEVNARGRRVDAPENDEPRFRVILVGDARHLSVHRLCRGPGRRRAHRAPQTGRAEPPEQNRVQRVLREQAVRAAVGKRQDGFGAPLLSHLVQTADDELEGFFPGHARETGLALRPAAHGGMPQPRLAVHALAEFPDLRANVSARRRVERRAVDADEASLADRDGETAANQDSRGDRRCRRRRFPFRVSIKHPRHAARVQNRARSRGGRSGGDTASARPRRSGVFAGPVSGDSALAHLGRATSRPFALFDVIVLVRHRRRPSVVDDAPAWIAAPERKGGRRRRARARHGRHRRGLVSVVSCGLGIELSAPAASRAA